MIRKRRYTLKRRAENQAETRRRIVEATVDLHAELGPAHTSITASPSGPACSGIPSMPISARNANWALPARGWRLNVIHCRTSVPGGRSPIRQRLRRALTEIYAWYARNTELIDSVMRDAEVDP